MKPLLLLLLIAFFPIAQQSDRQEPDLLVIKFGLLKEKQPTSSMIRGAQNPGGPITTPMAADDRDLGSRKTDLRAIDAKAAVSATKEKEVPSFEFRLELKNSGEKNVRGFIWEFQQTAHDESQPKQYLCALHVLPGEKKVLDIWTPYLPQKVVSADKRKDPLLDGTVVINQIEYADGSVWKKSGWNYKLPADSLGRLTEGRCSVF